MPFAKPRAFAATCIAFLCLVAPVRAANVDEPSGLAAYVAKPDPSFSWREVRDGRFSSVTYVELLMTSQTWRDMPWKHQLFVLWPDNIRKDSRQALLFIHGGRWKQEYETTPGQSDLPREARLFARLAQAIRAPIGVLRQVPHQPLFERREDALIAYTFDRYLETGESDWPLLLPMVKSAVRAMDVVSSVASTHASVTIDTFTVSGASKRGWTSWLAAAVDERVVAVAPMVIDVLNMQAQMELQRATWGDVSEQIHDYSALDLPARLLTDRGRELLALVDPYSYRHRLMRPKLILLSTNDRYWPLDALKLYWPDLPEQKHVLYVPNQGHGLRDANRVIGALSALHRYTAAGKSLPRLSWELAEGTRDMRMTVGIDRKAHRVSIWSAHSPTRDFREARWSSSSCAGAAKEYRCRGRRAKQGFTATFAEASFRDKGEPEFSLSTTVFIAGPPSRTASSTSDSPDAVAARVQSAP